MDWSKFALIGLLASACSGEPSKPAILANPNIRFVVWGGQNPTPLETDWRNLLVNGVFDRLQEYGVKSGTLGITIQAFPDLQPAIFDDTWIVTQLLNEVDGTNSQTIFVVVLPPGSSTKLLQAEHAIGYHLWAAVPYAVVTANEVLISHEVYEAATDPYGLGVKIGTNEVGDLCEGQYDVIGGVTVQKVWSIKEGQCT